MRTTAKLLLLSLAITGSSVCAQDLPPQVPAAAENFYFHANYDWIKNTTLPGDRSIWNTFSVLDQRNS
ncbi:hypothetical protein K7432_005369, partial [Basidiobolus ranarum]